MSKPKAVRSCACCGLKTDKSKLLRINLPDLSFDFYQNNNFRSFYVCQNPKCTSRVLKKYAVAKHLKTNIENKENILLENIKNKLAEIITDLYNKNSADVEKIKENSSLILCKRNACITGENIIFAGSNLYKGSAVACVVRSKSCADLLINYKNIIIYIDGLMEN